MPDPAWASSPPEVNYLRLLGPGAAGTATTLASGAAWQALMAGQEASIAASEANATVTALDFEGIGGTSSGVAVSGLNTALQLLSCWVQEKVPIAASGVAAYEAAVSSMIPAEVALANRAEQAADVALNPLVLGALTPAIVALDTVYFGEFWPQNASSGAVYGAALAALVAALAVPPPMPPPGAAGAPATAAMAIAQASGQLAAGEAMKETAHAVTDAGSGASAPVQAVAEGAQMVSALGQPAQATMGALQPATGMFGGIAQTLTGVSPSMMVGTSGDRTLDGRVEGQLPPPLLGPVGTLGVGGAAAPVGTVGAAGGYGSAGLSGAGVTTYARPNSSFPSESSSRPTGLKTGLLGGGDMRATGIGGNGGGAVPLGPATAPGQAKGGSEKVGVVHARVAVPGAPRTKGDPAN